MSCFFKHMKWDVAEFEERNAGKERNKIWSLC